jgi:hypothetical protein
MKKLPEKIEANLIVILEAASTALRNKASRKLIVKDLDLSDDAADDLLDAILAYLTEDYADGWKDTHPSEVLSKAEILNCLKGCSPAVNAFLLNK